MPWHDQQMYLDELERDMRARIERLREAGADVGGGSSQTETFDLTTSAGLAEMGVKVRRHAQ